MELNDTRSIDKRQITLTPRAFEYKLEKLQEERQVKIRKIKGAIREIKDLKQSADNAEKIRSCLENISSLFKEASHLHGVVVPMLPPEEQEKQNAWFGSVEEHKIAFVEETNEWLLEAPDILEERVVSPCLGSVSNDEARISKIVEKAVEDDIRPRDSVSNVSVRSKKCSSVASKFMSITSSARLRAEAETAALMARQRLLSQKHALEEQQELLRRKKEELDLDMELAASMAKGIKLKDVPRDQSMTPCIPPEVNTSC